MALLTSASGNTLAMTIQRTGFEDSAYLVYLSAGFFIMLIILYFAKKYIRVPAERSDYLHIPELAPEVRVWDDTNVESLISLQGGTIPLTPKPSNKPSQDNWPGLIPAVLHYLGFRETGRNLSVYRRYLLETLQNEAKARISLRELAVRHKYFEQEAVNEQLRLENERVELLWERRRIEMENRWRLKFFSSASDDTQSRNSSAVGSEILNYFHQKQPPRIRCTFRVCFDEHSESVESISFSPDSKFLASGSWDSTVKIWDLYQQHCVRTFTVEAKAYSVAFSPAKQSGVLAAGTETGRIELWATEPGGWQPQVALFDHSEVVESLAFSPDGKWLASGSWDRKACLWDLSAKPKDSQASHRGADLEATGYKDAIAQVAFSPSHKQAILALVGWDKTLEILDLSQTLESGAPYKRIHLANPLDKVSTVTFSADGETFAAATTDGVVRLWLTSTSPWQVRATLSVHDDEISSLSFSRKGNLLAIGLLDGTIKLWNIEDINNPQIIVTDRRHTAAITCVAFSPNGKTLATASRDNTINLWDVKVLFPYSSSNH